MAGSKNNDLIQASILIADIRNFTPNLKDSETSDKMHLVFSHFLSDFYTCCLEACLTACNDKRSLYINSTGDGILGVFFSPKRHHLDAYLAGILLFNKLPTLFERYNRHKHKRVADVSFGIGVESGNVWRVTSSNGDGGPSIETYIGDCINIAARVEAVTKDHDRTTMIVAEHLDLLLCKQLFGDDYQDLMNKATDDSVSGARRKKIWEQMNALDEKLLLRFISAYNLRGVSKPLRLFRLSPTLATPSRKECQRVLKRAAMDEDHYRNIDYYLKH